MKKAAKKSGMKKRAMRRSMKKKVSNKGKKWQVFKGNKLSTKGGLKKGDLIKNKRGKVVSKKASLRAKQRFGARASHGSRWRD